MRADAHGEEEGEQRPTETPQREPRRKGGADGDVGKVPCRVRRMKQRDPVADAAGAGTEGVEGRTAGHVGHHGPAFVPHITKPPPTLISRQPTPWKPACSQARTWSSTDIRA